MPPVHVAPCGTDRVELVKEVIQPVDTQKAAVRVIQPAVGGEVPGGTHNIKCGRRIQKYRRIGHIMDGHSAIVHRQGVCINMIGRFRRKTDIKVAHEAAVMENAEFNRIGPIRNGYG